ncbi:MAG TPA: Ldh family oxidoreductase [Acetobacteraceae bacterium]|nr:Ldh family oxidoreductase [Acetobacteraceae bacterium]
MTSTIRVPQAALAQFACDLLIAAGAGTGEAKIVVDHLIEADRLGLPSHGVLRVPQYIGEIESGEIDPRATPHVARSAPGRAAVDGRRGFGQVVGRAMADEAVRLAASAGVGFVTGRHMGHTGRIGAYAERIAGQGCVGLLVCSGPRSGHRVAPFGGREGRLATNPIAFACPRHDAPPLAADFSTSVAPEGVIRSLLQRGLRAPAGALRDAEGRPTDDPAALYTQPPGVLQPLGAAVGYRGTALAILVEILAALLAGDETEDLARLGSNLAMLAIATDGEYSARADRMAAYLRSAPPLDPAAPVLLPGERERQMAARAGDGSIAVDRPTWEAMVAAAGSRIAVPVLAAGEAQS